MPNPNSHVPITEKDLPNPEYLRWLEEVSKHVDGLVSWGTRGTVVIDNVDGLVLKDTDSHYWRLTVETDGSLTTTDLGTVKPDA